LVTVAHRGRRTGGPPSVEFYRSPIMMWTIFEQLPQEIVNPGFRPEPALRPALIRPHRLGDSPTFRTPAAAAPGRRIAQLLRKYRKQREFASSPAGSQVWHLRCSSIDGLLI
jgi:hypothetical protein